MADSEAHLPKYYWSFGLGRHDVMGVATPQIVSSTTPTRVKEDHLQKNMLIQIWKNRNFDTVLQTCTAMWNSVAA